MVSDQLRLVEPAQTLAAGVQGNGNYGGSFKVGLQGGFNDEIDQDRRQYLADVADQRVFEVPDEVADRAVFVLGCDQQSRKSDFPGRAVRVGKPQEGSFATNDAATGLRRGFLLAPKAKAKPLYPPV